VSDNLKTLQSIAKSMDNPVIQWAAAEIARLREYALADARCPCCDNAERCVDDCTFAADCPAEWQRMVAARTALGVAVKEVGRE